MNFKKKLKYFFVSKLGSASNFHGWGKQSLMLLTFLMLFVPSFMNKLKYPQALTFSLVIKFVFPIKLLTV